MLSIAAGVAILVRYIRIPYTVTLVLVGLLVNTAAAVGNHDQQRIDFGAAGSAIDF